MPVAALSEYLGTRRAQIDEALVRFLPAAPDCPPVLYEAMRYSLDAGGKRLRPILTLAAAETIASLDVARDAPSYCRGAGPHRPAPLAGPDQCPCR